ncbi:MAG: DNA mismatch repair endonuclease MutL [Candidatus Cloacimonetes bacterium]|nr:DNA mismatch repair endonuclease MutL [Candidatus Cloacimonadota bacterium]
MQTIKVLAEEVANRIAAGEVVERPVSVVKELVENAIDAGAGEITVRIESGGKRLIEVADDGCGMSEEDALTAFERHATSKIRTVDDIVSIRSLGFRGEALPSIASVSSLTLVSRTADDELATRVEFVAGQMRDMSKAAANPGTTVSVRKLFANVPARRKFLRTDAVELRHILNYMHYQAVLLPQVHFRLFVDGKQRLNYPSTETRHQRMLAVFGSGFERQDMIPVKAESPRINIHGYIKGLEETGPGFDDYHYLYVNGRFIRDRIVNHSIRAAYDPFVKKMRLPRQGLMPYILFLEIDPALVDFNVHPAKLELRFRDAQLVHGFLKTTLTGALTDYEENKFASVKQKLKQGSGQLSRAEKHILSNREQPPAPQQVRQEMDALYQPDLFRPDDPPVPRETPQPRLALPPEEELVNPWQLHLTYILVQVEEGLLLIDQHAAHERVLYERFIQRIAGGPSPVQKLLFPLVIDIPPVVRHVVEDLVSENSEQIERAGFGLKTFSGDSVVIDQIPAELESWEGGEVFIDILHQLGEEFGETEDFRDSLAKSIACKAAIKAGKRMTRKEMVQLINDVFACQMPWFCPHGRPLMIRMTLTELEKRFKRIES